MFRLGGGTDSPAVAVIFNPFRDRDPERAADIWLKPGLASRWDQVRASKTPVEWSAHICGDATPGTHVHWRLEYREDLQENVMLVYKVECSNYEGRLFVHLDKNRGVWRVTSFKPSDAQPWDGRLR
jgi:hypothetical protein